MPTLPIVRTANASISYPYRPVALFVGGTAGIGEGMARAFAQHAHGNADVFIAGRNRAAGEAILASMPTVAPMDGAPAPRREFVECDATLMRNVRRAAAEVKTKTDRVNFMVITSGMLGFQGRDETEEGIDRKLALHYYARWTFIHEYAEIYICSRVPALTLLRIQDVPHHAEGKGRWPRCKSHERLCRGEW